MDSSTLSATHDALLLPDDPIDYSSIRIRKWKSATKELVDKTEGKSGQERAQKLEKIAISREEKARNSDSKAWTGNVTWIHVPSNSMTLCKVWSTMLDNS